MLMRVNKINKLKASGLLSFCFHIQLNSVFESQFLSKSIFFVTAIFIPSNSSIRLVVMILTH